MKPVVRIPTSCPASWALSWLVVAALGLAGSLAGCDVGSALSTGEAVGTDPEASPPGLSARAGAAPLRPQTGAGTGSSAGRQISESRETAIVRASELVSPSVVAVNVLRTEQVRVADPFLSFFPFGAFSSTQARRVPSLGSGFVIDPSGIILTNDHVVAGAEQILVTFPDGRDAGAELVGTDELTDVAGAEQILVTFPDGRDAGAELVGTDELTDVAVLRIDAENLTAAPLGNTADLRIGEWVIAFGNPFGNLLSNPEPTVTVGVTSAIGRHIVPSGDEGGFYLGMIQTDAAINPGNSGGPLVNADGQVIGMNTSIFSRSGGSEGMGFAIPIERALGIAEDILAYGQVRRAWVGIYAEPEEADAFGRTREVRVAQVAPESPAAGAGIEAGDRLLEVNGTRLVTPLDFDAALLDLQVGDAVSVIIEGRARAVPMSAEEIPSLRAERVRLFDGLDLVTLTPAIRAERRIGSESGALVVGISSPQIESVTGLREGDVILSVGRRPIRSAEELSTLLRQIPARTRIQFVLERNGQLIATQEFVLGE